MARKKRPPLFELARESRVHSARVGGMSGCGTAVEQRPQRSSAPVGSPPEPPAAPAHTQPTPAPTPAPSAYPAAAAAEAAASDWKRWITPGRSLRVPVGYVFLTAAALVAVMLGSYVLGFRRGAVNRERELIALRGDAALAGPAVDPLLDQQGRTPQAGVAPTNAAGRSGGRSGGMDAADAAAALGPFVGGAVDDASTGDAPDASPKQLTRDPLVIEDAVRNPLTPDLNYYVVDRLRPDEALAAARYLRLHGVEAAVFPEHLVFGGEREGRLRLVVALRGFASGEVSSDASKRYAARIRDIGRRWQAEENGVSDFSTMYAAKHRR